MGVLTGAPVRAKLIGRLFFGFFKIFFGITAVLFFFAWHQARNDSGSFIVPILSPPALFYINLTVFDIFLGFLSTVTLSVWFYKLHRNGYLRALPYSRTLHHSIVIAILSICAFLILVEKLARHLKPDTAVFYSQGALRLQCLKMKKKPSYRSFATDGKVFLQLLKLNPTDTGNILVLYRHHGKYGFWGTVKPRADCSLPNSTFFSERHKEREIRLSYGDDAYTSAKKNLQISFTQILTRHVKLDDFEHTLLSALRNFLGLGFDGATTDAAPIRLQRSWWAKNAILPLIFLVFGCIFLFLSGVRQKSLGQKILLCWLLIALVVGITG